MGAFWSSFAPAAFATFSGISSATRFTATSSPALRAPSTTASAIRSIWP